MVLSRCIIKNFWKTSFVNIEAIHLYKVALEFSFGTIYLPLLE